MEQETSRIDFIRQRDGEAAVAPYCALMRKAYRGAVLRGGRGKTPINKTHPYRRQWIEGYLEFRKG
jgi:hypothetical protein